MVTATMQDREAKPGAGSGSGPVKGVGLTYNERPDFPGLVTHGCWVGGMGGATGTPRPLLWRKEQRAARLRD